MSKFLWQVSYTPQGAKGVLSEGGSSRRQTIESLVDGLGGSIESWYYTFGDDDLVIIAELPNNATATALSLTVAASGAARIKTTPLIDMAEVDAAAGLAVPYRAPGV
jgi:uncharacterized protein with GYD domain